MIPIFKSHYSIGKSILTLNPIEKNNSSGSDSIFDILIEHDLKTLVLVDDSPTGFLQARKYCIEYGINFIFGIRLNFDCNSIDDQESSLHKNIIFARNDSGCKLVNQIYSDSFCSDRKVCSYEILKQHWSEEDLMLTIPFYDSFLYNNTFSFSNCIPDFTFTQPTFFIENNLLPTDLLHADIVKNYCQEFGYETELVKSIFYKNNSDIESLQAYKCICNRGFGKNRTLSKPNLDKFGSHHFSFESWLSSVK